MKLAIEKLSPITTGAIFVANFSVVIRATAIMSSVLAAILLVQNAEQLQPPLWWYGIPLVVMLMANKGFAKDILEGSALRKMKYQGTIVWERMKLSADPELPFTGWTNQLPVWGLRKSGLYDWLESEARAELKKLDSEQSYVIFVLGKNEDNDYVLKRFHCCKNDATCEKHALHLFGYDEKRDGAVWWGV